jgi:hypothetical protein
MMRDLEDEARIKEYMKAKMKHIKMYNECMNLADGLDVAKFAELVRADERAKCVKAIEKECERWDSNYKEVAMELAGMIEGLK